MKSIFFFFFFFYKPASLFASGDSGTVDVDSKDVSRGAAESPSLGERSVFDST